MAKPGETESEPGVIRTGPKQPTVGVAEVNQADTDAPPQAGSAPGREDVVVETVNPDDVSGNIEALNRAVKENDLEAEIPATERAKEHRR